MFEGLFGEEETGGDSTKISPSGVKGGGDRLDVPSAPRLPCGLAGINNQGATCYLNSLLQTLLYTPEFRDCLFSLDDSELGILEQRGQPGTKVRVIPIQLQRLFARLLLSDQQSVSTTDLTDSFGWTNNEELQQQDVQELNRILFSAIEDSLVGTSGQSFISNLYHGKLVNQIICQECKRVSEREEDFLDLTLTVSGSQSIEVSLFESYCDMETMDGQNQYRCEQCGKLVNAKKGAKLRTLPTILTLSLLRFSFNFQTMERYKENGKMSFPLTLDMSTYVQETSPSETNMYELFSVVIHRGGAYGGHYHAYIRDIDALGNWMPPEEEEIRLPIDPSTGNVDYLEVDTPVDLLIALLSRAGPQGLILDKLCSEMTKQTGVSWNKRFKKQYGPVNKFLKKHEDLFDFDTNTNWVTLKTKSSDHHLLNCNGDSADKENVPVALETGSENNVSEKNLETSKEIEETKPKSTRAPSPQPLSGYCWFNFDDSRVHPIKENEIENQFSGKESAYMLFYRRVGKSSTSPRRDVPDKLVSMVIAENEELQRKRLEYSTAVNSVTLKVHFGSYYEYIRGALHPQDGSFYFIEITLDRRKTIFELAQQIQENAGEIIHDVFTIHRLKTLPSGGHLYEEFPIDDVTRNLLDCAIVNGTELFVWNGEKVHGQVVPTGSDCEPICLTVMHGNPSQITQGFPKNLTLQEFKVVVSEFVGHLPNDLDIERLIINDNDVKTIEFTSEQLNVSLENLKLKDGDQLVVSERGSRRLSDSLALSSNPQNTVRYTVENRCVQMSSDCRWPVLFVVVDKNASVGELKLTAVSKAGLQEIPEGGRIRVDHDTLGLQPPLFEALSLSAAHLTSVTSLVLEPGAAPLSNQMTLTFTSEELKGDCPYMELTLDKTVSVGVCLSLMIGKAGLTGESWHLCKSNWCGERSDVLNDMEISIEEATLHHGGHVLIEPGKLPPKGFVCLSVSLYPSPNCVYSGADNSTGMLDWITQSIQGMFTSTSSGQGDSGDAFTPLPLGEVVISKEASLDDLKLQVMTLPEVMALPIPSPDFLRLRLVEQGQLSTVLKGSTFTLQRLKLNSNSEIAIQVLPIEEKLMQHHVILKVQQRLCSSKSYGPAVEIVWNTERAASATSLRQTIADIMAIPAQKLIVAKHFPEKFEWKIIQDLIKKTGSSKGKKKFLQPKSNIKNSPYFLRDGDRIGVKNLDEDPDRNDGFRTVEDDLGKERLLQELEDKRLRREENKQNNQKERKFYQPRKPEVGLKIQVDNFT